MNPPGANTTTARGADRGTRLVAVRRGRIVTVEAVDVDARILIGLKPGAALKFAEALVRYARLIQVSQDLKRRNGTKDDQEVTA